MKKSTKVKIFSIIGFVIFFFLLMLFLLSDENVEIIKSVFLYNRGNLSTAW